MTKYKYYRFTTDEELFDDTNHDRDGDGLADMVERAIGTDPTDADSDDDGLSDTHAQLDWTAPEDGVYVVRARSYAPGAVGDYALTIEKQP